MNYWNATENVARLLTLLLYFTNGIGKIELYSMYVNNNMCLSGFNIIVETFGPYKDGKTLLNLPRFVQCVSTLNKNRIAMTLYHCNSLRMSANEYVWTSKSEG